MIGIVTEVVAVRPVLKNLEQHLYVLSTLALALMIKQVAAVEWSTEPQPFPRLFSFGTGVWEEKFWLPIVALIVVIAGLELLNRYTLMGRAFLAISEDTFAARALGAAGAEPARDQFRARRRHRQPGGICRRADAAGLFRQRHDADVLRIHPRSLSAGWAAIAAP